MAVRAAAKAAAKEREEGASDMSATDSSSQNLGGRGNKTAPSSSRTAAQKPNLNSEHTFAESLYIGNSPLSPGAPGGQNPLVGPILSLNTNGTKISKENGVKELFQYAHLAKAKFYAYKTTDAIGIQLVASEKLPYTTGCLSWITERN